MTFRIRTMNFSPMIEGRVVLNEGTLEEKVITQIKKIDKNKKYLGTARGIEMGHCIYIANRYCPNFDEKVKCYYLPAFGDNYPKDLLETRGLLEVEFYGEKK